MYGLIQTYLCLYTLLESALRHFTIFIILGKHENTLQLKECTETPLHAFISCKSDYCNSLLYGAPNYLLQKMQRVQNAAARLIFQESKFSHVTPQLRSLHWLPVTQGIHFKLLLIIFKAIHGHAPSYISDLISIRRTGRYNLRLI